MRPTARQDNQLLDAPLLVGDRRAGAGGRWFGGHGGDLALTWLPRPPFGYDEGMRVPAVISRVHRAAFWLGIISLVISALPWLGASEYSFGLPGGTALPTLNVVTLDNRGSVWKMLEAPVELAGQLPGMRSFVFFGGRDTHVLTPFALFVFYFAFGVLCLFAGRIPRVSLRGLFCSVGLICVALGCVMSIHRANNKAYRDKVREAVQSGRFPLYDDWRCYFTENELRNFDPAVPHEPHDPRSRPE